MTAHRESQMNHRLLQDFCLEQQIPFQTNISLQKYNTFRVASTADVFLDVDFSQAQKLIPFFYQQQLDFFVIGGGSNLLLAEKISTPVVHIKKEEQTISIEECSNNLELSENNFCLHVSAAVSSARFASFACEHGFSGAEFLSTIPGTLGGALVQNAGCYGSEMKDIVISAKVLTSQGEKNLTLEQLELSYRDSIFKREAWFIESIVFKLPKETDSLCKEKTKDFRKRRNATQPKGKTAGSVFRNPRLKNFASAWQVVQEIGLQGKSVNGAEFSVLHANFIVNHKAKAADIYRLIRLAQDLALQKTGVALQLEIVLLGDFSVE